MSSQALDRVLANPKVQAHMCAVGHKVDRTMDVPYLAGYSQDGQTIYFDRHLPETLSFEEDGQCHEFRPEQFVRYHEDLEKALIDVLRWGYWPAHSAANGYERRHVIQAMGPGSWPLYEKALMPYIKAEERERLERVPADLDMTPYYSSPVDKSLIARIQEAQGKRRQFAKMEVGYTDKGMPRSHCGPVNEWPRGACAHFEKPHGCDLVRGYIEPRGWCKKWKDVDGATIPQAR